MSARLVPNTFQTHNFYVDKAMELLTDAELRCLLFATRHILGWQDRINSRRATISVSMFEHGYGTEDGSRFGGTGLSRGSIIKATAELSRFGLLVPEGKATTDGQEWLLGDLPDWDALEQRAKEKNEKRRKQTAKGRQKQRSIKQTSGELDRPVVNQTDQQRSIKQTSGGELDTLNQSHIQNQNQNHISANAPKPSKSSKKAKAPKPYDDVPHSTRTGIIAAWVNNLLVKPIGNVYARDDSHTRAAEIHHAGYTAHDVERYVKAMMQETYWQTEGTLTLKVVCEYMPTWLARNPEKAAQTPAQYPTQAELDAAVPSTDDFVRMEAVS